MTGPPVHLIFMFACARFLFLLLFLFLFLFQSLKASVCCMGCLQNAWRWHNLYPVPMLTTWTRATGFDLIIIKWILIYKLECLMISGSILTVCDIYWTIHICMYVYAHWRNSLNSVSFVWFIFFLFSKSRLGRLLEVHKLSSLHQMNQGSRSARDLLARIRTYAFLQVTFHGNVLSVIIHFAVASLPPVPYQQRAIKLWAAIRSTCPASCQAGLDSCRSRTISRQFSAGAKLIRRQSG